MKKISHYFALCTIFVLATAVSCTPNEAGGTQPRAGVEEIEIEISTGPRGSTRAPLDGMDIDEGNANESLIETLDLLVFGADGYYLYRSEGTAISTNGGITTFIARFQQTDEELTIHILANSRGQMLEWENALDAASTDPTTLDWPGVHAQLVDTNPARLINSADFTPLPMWGTLENKTLSKTLSPTPWGPVQMLRSVASADLYVARTAATADFELSDLFVYYAPSEGYLGAIEEGNGSDPAQYKVPSTMTSSLDAVEAEGRMRATGIATYAVGEGADAAQYDGIAYQTYVYDNPWVATGDDNARPTRLIVAGYYKGSEVKSYYPVDITDTDGTYRPLIRNWKYEFRVRSVSGAGYDNLDEAAQSAVTDINMEIIEWNKGDEAIGVDGGMYYMTRSSDEAILQRQAGSTRTVTLTYNVKDGRPVTGDDFSLAWAGGPDTPPATTFVENDYFTVDMVITPDPDVEGTGTVTLLFTAKQDNDELEERMDEVEVSFRDLLFTIDVRQLDGASDGWDDGGEIPVEA